ncbi:MAG: Re/Si-specific NAD(P)(+) transhydrogenase subunit alpha [Alphaproteobacteria bacterium]|nr:Re/Si-specific NAD(P)(+) transhydrogenase subunit alpha [Alphaproteobacteria bacterium]
MKVAIPKERREKETRVAISEMAIKKLVNLGFEVVIEKGAGKAANISDDKFKKAGASIGSTLQSTLKDADVVWKINRPMTKDEGEDEISLMKKGAVLCANMNALQNPDNIKTMADAGISAFAMELMPRISRAQSMDILSSQNNLAGYKAVIDAAAEYGKAMPMMMTSAGTIPPAQVLVLGAGVAGLQAIATAKRLGAVVYASDVRPAAKEQVESLGGRFVEVDDEAMANAENSDGYAKEMSADFKKRQAKAVHERLKKTDIAICTALIPGKPAPELISEKMLKDMKEGSVIVDLAVEAGGNCPLSEKGKVVTKHGVKLIGYTNVAGRLSADASMLFANNLFNLLGLMLDEKKEKLELDFKDEIIKECCITHDKKIVHPALTEQTKDEVKAKAKPKPSTKTEKSTDKKISAKAKGGK